MFSKILDTKSSISTKKNPFITFFATFFPSTQKKLQTTTSGVQKKYPTAKETLAMPDKQQRLPERNPQEKISLQQASWT
jgi:hypothetical protein